MHTILCARPDQIGTNLIEILFNFHLNLEGPISISTCARQGILFQIQNYLGACISTNQSYQSEYYRYRDEIPEF